MTSASSSFFRDIGVGTRLLLLMGLGVLAVAVAGGVLAIADRHTGATLERHDAFVRILDLSQEAESGLANLRAAETAFLLRGDRAAADTYAKQSARLLAVFKSLGDIAQAAPIRQAIDTLRDGVAEHATEFGKIADLEGKGPAMRLDQARKATAAAAAAIEKALLEPGREALAAQMLALEPDVRRVLAGEPQAAVDMVKTRTDGFDRSLVQAGLGETETARLADLMNAYFSAVLDQAAASGRQQKAAARLDEILGYLRPSRDALAGFRRQAVGAIGDTAEERDDAETWMYLSIAGAAALFVVVGGLLALGISRPLRGLAFAARQLSDGNRETFIPVSAAGDEIGDLARALRATRDDVIETEGRLRAREQRDKAAGLREEVTQRAMLDEIGGSIREAVEAIAAAATELRRLAEAAGGGVAAIGHHAGDITAASGETTASLRKLASVASNLHIGLVETQRGLTTDVPAEEAIGDPAVEARTAELGRLAIRTRLMALNAVIGATHAGDGGDGPAIEEIATDIADLTQRIAEESAALAALKRTRAPAQPPLGDLARSIQGHGTATRAILRNAEGAVAAALALTNAISRITRTAGETGEITVAIQRAAEEAARRSETLRGEVDGILARLRS